MVDLGKEYSTIDIKVHNVTGSMVKNKSFYNTQFCNIDLDSETKGMLFFTITLNNIEKQLVKLLKN